MHDPVCTPKKNPWLRPWVQSEELLVVRIWFLIEETMHRSYSKCPVPVHNVKKQGNTYI